MPATTKEEFEAVAKLFQDSFEPSILGYDANAVFSYKRKSEKSNLIRNFP